MKFRFLNRPIPPTYKGRKYPIQRDEEGESMRKRCFELFRRGRSAREAAEVLGMKLATARRYYSQWNECPPYLEAICKGIREGLKNGTLSQGIIRMLQEAYKMPQWEIYNILARPNGIKSLIMGRYAKIRRQELYDEQEARLGAALQLVVDLERIGVPLEWIRREVSSMMQRAIRYVDARKNEGQDDEDDEG